MDSPTPERAFLKQRDYAAIIDTNDEFEDLIGIVDEVFNDEGESVKDTNSGSKVALRIPLTREEQKTFNLYGTNEITRYARQQIILNNGCLLVDIKNLESFNPEDL